MLQDSLMRRSTIKRWNKIVSGAALASRLQKLNAEANGEDEANSATASAELLANSKRQERKRDGY